MVEVKPAADAPARPAAIHPSAMCVGVWVNYQPAIITASRGKTRFNIIHHSNEYVRKIANKKQACQSSERISHADNFLRTETDCVNAEIILLL